MSHKKYVTVIKGCITSLYQGAAPHPSSLQKGEMIVEVSEAFSLETHRVVNGEEVEYTDVQKADRASNKPYPHRWDDAVCSWIDPRNIDQIEVDRQRGVLRDIALLEAQLTPRRMREALISGDLSSISALESQISLLRGTLCQP
jgi:hypothetical protein